MVDQILRWLHPNAIPVLSVVLSSVMFLLVLIISVSGTVRALICGIYIILSYARSRQFRLLKVTNKTRIASDAVSIILITGSSLELLVFEPLSELSLIIAWIASPMVLLFFGAWKETVTAGMKGDVLSGTRLDITFLALLNLAEELFPGICHFNRYRLLIFSVTFVLLMTALSLPRKFSISDLLPVACFAAYLGLVWLWLLTSDVFLYHPHLCVLLLAVNFARIVSRLSVSFIQTSQVILIPLLPRDVGLYACLVVSAVSFIF
jgi:hypothetical protein